jgi:Holliday junction resolvase RusA-like endonuclease
VIPVGSGARRKMIMPEASRAYQTKVRLWALQARQRRPQWPLDKQYAITLRVYFPDARRRDLDNVAKQVLDCLNDVIWHDDVQVVEIHASKAIDRDRPRIEVEVRA